MILASNVITSLLVHNRNAYAQEDACTEIFQKHPPLDQPMFNEYNPKPQPIGDKCISVIVRSEPYLITVNNPQPISINITTVDVSGTDLKLPHVTYDVTILDSFNENTQLMHQLFHSHGSNLVLRFDSSGNLGSDEADYRIIDNNKVQSAIVGNVTIANSNGTVNIKSPLFLKSSIYHFHVTVLGIEDDSILNETKSENTTMSFQNSNHPSFDTHVTIGEAYPIQLSISHNSEHSHYNATVISYVSSISKVSFDNSTNTISWFMPYNLNASALKNIPSLFIHEEIRMPKSFPNLYNFSNSYTANVNATANGIHLDGRKLAIDPYTYNDTIVYHYLLNRDDIIQIAENTTRALSDGTDSSATDAMTFTLSPIHIVPEFSPIIVLVILAGILGVVITMGRMRRYRNLRV